MLMSPMALTIQLDPETEKRLNEAAAARGVTPEALAAEAVAAVWDDDDWEEDERRMNEPGDSIPAEDVFTEVRAQIAAAQAAARK